MTDEKTNSLCEVFCSNEEKVESIQADFLPEQAIIDLSDIFKVISDKSRVKIMLALKETELCVCDLSHILSISVSAVSHQLRILRSHKFVKFRNEGKIVFYSLTDDKIINLLEEGLKQLVNYQEK